MKKLFVILLTVAFFGCNDDDSTDDPIFCTEDLRPGLEVTVTDGINGDPITEGVNVVVVDGEYTETLIHIEGTGTFVGAYERVGNYIITATKEGYNDSTTAEPIIVEEDACHVITEKVSIILQKK